MCGLYRNMCCMHNTIDILFIEQLIVMAVIGVHDWERKCFQKLIFDVELAYNSNRNTAKKYCMNLYPYIDYTQVRAIIFKIVHGKKFLLIEDVAEITTKQLIRYFCVDWVRMTVRKPSAISDASSVGICIKRTK